jgi:ribosomal protein S27E
MSIAGIRIAIPKDLKSVNEHINNKVITAQVKCLRCGNITPVLMSNVRVNKVKFEVLVKQSIDTPYIFIQAPITEVTCTCGNIIAVIPSNYIDIKTKLI